MANTDVPLEVNIRRYALPAVSVVMPSFNQARFIDGAVESVLCQDHRVLELLVADGGSTDGTVDKLHAWRQRDPRVRFVSEPDSGPANALNKAFGRVRGTVVGWLNSDDLYTPGSVRRAIETLESRHELAAVYGHGEHVDAVGGFLSSYPTLEPTVEISRFFDGCFICQPTMFLKRSTLSLLGPLDESYRASFDFDYWLRLFTEMPGRIGFVNAVQAKSRLHDDCITLKLRKNVALEGLRTLHAHLGKAPLHWLWTYESELKGPRQSLSDLSEAERADLRITALAAQQWLTTDQFRHVLARWG